MTTDRLAEFIGRGQAAQRAVDELGAGEPSYWWHVRLRAEPDLFPSFWAERVHAPDSRSACKLAISAARERWPGHEFYVADLLQEGL
jgi:hypothetical protein